MKNYRTTHLVIDLGLGGSWRMSAAVAASATSFLGLLGRLAFRQKRLSIFLNSPGSWERSVCL